jgi:putative GTP pyrophosphokinase
MNSIDNHEWYSQKQFLYLSLLTNVQQLLETLLSDKEIHHLPIQKRVKTFDSLMRKMITKEYASPEQVTDLGGLRIIGYIKSDVRKIDDVVQQNFEVDPPGKEDKAKELGVNRVGYLSTHYVVSLSKKRTSLPEHKKYDGLSFEIQVSTILQQAWAEIEHDRNYKFAGELTEEIKREFFLLAGLLEYADNGFQRLSDDIERYSATISQQVKEGRLEAKIDPITIKSYLSQKYPEVKNAGLINKDAIDELESKGIKNLSDLTSMISNETEKYRKLSSIVDSPLSRIAVADIYNSRDKAILRPKFLRAVFDISDRDNRVCVSEVESLKETGLGGYLEGIIPYVVADLEQDGLVEYCEKGEIRLTQKGRDEINKIVSGY